MPQPFSGRQALISGTDRLAVLILVDEAASAVVGGVPQLDRLARNAREAWPLAEVTLLERGREGEDSKGDAGALVSAASVMREVELNGEPSSREFVVGGKDGGVWAFSFNGTTASQIWSGSMSEKVTEISGIDVDGDGAEEAVLGDDNGSVAVFTGDGARNNLGSHSTGILRIDVGRLNGERYVIIADNSKIDVNRVNFNSIPGFQYMSLVVGVIVSAVILIIAAIMASIPQRPELKVSFQDKRGESLEAERRMLKESIHDVERLRKSGEVTGDAYLARLKRLRADLAENEAAFKTAGHPIKVETIQCPN